MPKQLVWTPELVGQFWKEISQSRLSELYFARLAGGMLLDTVAEELRPNARILDFGAGAGDLLEAILERGYHAAGYEPAKQGAAALAARFRGSPAFLGVVDDETAGRYDVIFMVEVIEHVLEGELKAVLGKVRSLLREGGTLILTTPNKEDLELNAAYCPGCDHFFHRWQHQRSFTAAKLESLLSEHGFEAKRVDKVEFSDKRRLLHEIAALRGRLAAREQNRGWARGLRVLASRLRPQRRHEPVYVGRGDTLLYVGTTHTG